MRSTITPAESLTSRSPVSPKAVFLWMLGIALVISGQVVLAMIRGDLTREGTMQILAGSLLIVGGLLFGAFIKPVTAYTARFDFYQNMSSSAFSWRSVWFIASIFTSTLLAAIAIFLFVKFGESKTVVILWLLGILLLFIGSIGQGKSLAPRPSTPRIYPAALAGLLVIAAMTRSYKLTTLPYNFDGDFASVGLEARALVTGQRQNIFAFGWADIPNLGYLPPALTMRLFGDNLTGLNASGVIEGLLVILGVYLLGRDLFNARTGLLAAALLTVSYTHLAASRQATYIDPVLFIVYAVYFLLLGLREERFWAIVASGILTALCLQLYYSGRIVIFIMGFVLLFLLIFYRASFTTRWWAIFVWALAILVTTGPMLIVFARSPEAFLSRSRDVFILAPPVVKHMQGVFQVNTVGEMLVQQLRHSLLLFHYYPDTGTQFGFRRPFLDPFAAVLFTLGIGYSLFHARWVGHSLMLAWIVIGVILGCFLTVNPPFWARLMVLLPPTALLAALALDLIYQQLAHGLQKVETQAVAIAPVITALMLGMVGFMNWNTYVELKGTSATARTYIGRYLAEQPVSTPAYLISNEYTYKDREFEFLAPGHLIGSISPDQLAANLPLPDPSARLILSAEQGPLVQMLQQLYPNATVEAHSGNSPSEVVFYVVQLR